MAVVCPGMNCGKTFKDNRAFKTHWWQKHKGEELPEEHKIETEHQQKQTRKLKNRMKRANITNDDYSEFQFVKPHDNDNTKYVCLLCEPNKVLGKRSAPTHILDQHKDKVSGDDFENWCLCLDARAVKNSPHANGAFELKYKAYLDKQAKQAQQSADPPQPQEAAAAGPIPVEEELDAVMEEKFQAWATKFGYVHQDSIIAAPAPMDRREKQPPHSGATNHPQQPSTEQERQPPRQVASQPARSSNWVDPSRQPPQQVQVNPDDQAADEASQLVPVRMLKPPGQIQQQGSTQVAVNAANVVKHMFDRLAEIQGSVGIQEPKCVKQKLVVTEEAKNFKMNDDWAQKRRHQWPFETKEWKDSGFKTYLMANVKSTEDRQRRNTVDGHLVALGRFKALFEVAGAPDEEIDEKAFMVNLMISGGLEEILPLDCFSPQLTWTDETLTACEFLKAYTKRHYHHNKDSGSKDKLDEWTSHGIAALRRKISSRKERSTQAHKEREYERLDAAATPEEAAKAVFEAMILLECIAAEYKGKDRTPPATRLRSHQLLAFIVNFNGFAGRPREWTTFQQQECLKQLDQNKTFLKMTDFKTSAKFDTVAKGLFPSTIQAILCHQTIPSVDGKAERLLLQPTPDEFKLSHKGKSGGDRYVKIDDCLVRVNEMLLAGTASLNPTNLRKRIHTRCSNGQESEDFQFLCLVDTHSVPVAASHYDLSNARPSDLAEKSRKLFVKYLGMPVRWIFSIKVVSMRSGFFV